MGTYAYHNGNIHFPMTRCLYLAESDNQAVLKIGISERPADRLRLLRYDMPPARGERKFIGVGFSVGTHIDESRLVAIARDMSRPISGAERFEWSEEMKARLMPFFPMTIEEAMKVAAERRAEERRRAEQILSEQTKGAT